MRSYTEQLTQYRDITGDASTANDTTGTRNMNNATRARLGGYDWPFLEKTDTDVTVASTQFYQLPADVGMLRGVTVTDGSNVHPVQEVASLDEWNALNYSPVTSTVPDYFYIRDKQIGFHPTPSTADKTITYNFKKKLVDLNTADYTTGTIAITSGAKAVTGSGTTFTAAMVGRYLKTTDGLWYEIASFTDTTHITIAKSYEGSTVTSGTYTIGQMSIFPDGYEDIPVFDAAAVYFLIKGNAEKAQGLSSLADGLYKAMKAEHGSKTTSLALTGTTGFSNPNNFWSV